MNKSVMVAAVFSLVGSAPGHAAIQSRELIEQALDETTKISLENVTLGDALSEVTRQTGVQIVMTPETMSLVPQGASTSIHRVDIENIPLRQGLLQLFSPLGMECQVTDKFVRVVPKRAIRELGRRPNWDELETLSWLSVKKPGINEDDLADLRTRVQFQVPAPRTWEILQSAIRNVGAGPGDEVLTAACEALGWGWTLSGKQIVVTPLEEQIRRRLQNRISLRMYRKPLFDVMSAIGEKVSVRVRVEPGALQHLPVQVQRAVDLDVFQETAQEALDKLAAFTHLGYLIAPDGVVFYRPEAGAAPFPEAKQPEGSETNAIRLSDPYVAKLVVPLPNGTSMEWLIRLSEMPEDLRSMRQSDIQKGFDALRKSREEN